MPLLIGLGAALTAVVLVVGAVMLFSGGSGGGADSPSQAVQQYFEALSRGDAKAALALGQSTPPDTTFLTDEILKEQTAQAPITNIRTLGETPGANGAVMVQVSVDIGGTPTADRIPVSEVDGGWKVPHAALELDLGRNNGIVKPELFDVLTVFGEPAPKSGTAYVFPGPVDLGSSNPFIAVTTRESSAPGLMNIFLGLTHQNPEFDVSEEGQTAILDAVTAKVTECTKSNLLAPPDCPVGIKLPGAVDGTAQWSAPAELDLSADWLDPRDGLVDFYGSAEFGLHVQTERGRLFEMPITASLSGNADLMQDPPTITYGS